MKLIVIQSAYTYKVLCERNLIDFAISKELNGFFDKAQLLVTGKLASGDQLDATRMVKFAASKDGVVSVSSSGATIADTLPIAPSPPCN